MTVALVEQSCQSSATRTRGLRGAKTTVVSWGGELAVPTGAGKVSGGGVNDAVPPVNAQHALAAAILGALHVGLKTAGSKLGKPHGRVIFDPGNGPALTAPQLAESFVD